MYTVDFSSLLAFFSQLATIDMSCAPALACKLRDPESSGADMLLAVRQCIFLLYERECNILPQIVAQLWMAWDASSARYASKS